MSSYLLLFSLAISASIGAVIPNPTATSPPYLKAFDVSLPQATYNPNFWNCTYKNGYQKVVMRGYQERDNGSRDLNFQFEYKTAISVGYKPGQIDSYIFPCTGDQNNCGSGPCKSVESQLKDYLSYINGSNIIVHRLWLNIEPDNSCNAWNFDSAKNTYDHSKNLAVAREWVNEIRSTKLNWGVYANPGQWADLFGTRNATIAPDLPLWAVQDDQNPDFDLKELMGGWTSAIAKQYNIGYFDKEGEYIMVHADPCGGNVDLDTFLE